VSQCVYHSTWAASARRRVRRDQGNSAFMRGGGVVSSSAGSGRRGRHLLVSASAANISSRIGVSIACAFRLITRRSIASAGDDIA